MNPFPSTLDTSATLEDALAGRMRRAVRFIAVFGSLAVIFTTTVELFSPTGANALQRWSRLAMFLLMTPVALAAHPRAPRRRILAFGIFFPTMSVAHALFSIATSGGGASDQIAIFPITIAASTLVMVVSPRLALPIYVAYFTAYVAVVCFFTPANAPASAITNALRWGVLGTMLSILGVWLNYRALKDTYAWRLALREESRRAALATERTRLSRELHDHIGARLIGIALRAERETERVPSEAKPVLAWMQETAALGLDELRDTIWALSHAGQDAVALAAALRRRAEDITAAAGLNLEWELDLGSQQEPVAPGTSVALSAIAREALTNSVRHSGAKTVRVNLRRDNDVLRLEVSDDGHGLPAPLVEGRGLANMRARATEQHGEIGFEKNEHGGLRVVATLPAHAAA